MKRAPLIRRTALASRCELQRRTAISPRSRKRAREERQYRKLRDAFLEGHDRCEYPEGCHAASTEVHHKRGRVGSLYLAVDHWAALCSWHHRWVTEHPVEAVRLGISELRVGGAA